jgi:DNA polymerase IV
MHEKQSIPTLCRDCLKITLDSESCDHCNNKRLISHPELLELSIAHMDCDAFYASVEKRDNPELKHKAVIIGGEKRGVVATACYLARMRGVHSAMPMFKAKKLCPEAVIVKPDMKKYSAISREIRALMQNLTPLVEPVSIDEAFLDLSGTARVHHMSPAATMAKLARDIENQIGITVSIGLSHNKFLAKLASDMDKPRGYTVIGNSDALEILATLPVGRIWGVGQALAKKLAQDGVTEVSQLQNMEQIPLMKRYGEMGNKLYNLSRGIDKRKVSPSSETKSISAERTLERDEWQYEKLEERLWPLCLEVSDDLKKQGYAANTITLKLKDSVHKLISRSHTLDNPTQLATTLFEQGQYLLKKETAKNTPYRLIGIGASNLMSPEQADPPDLIEPKRNKRITAEKTMDKLRLRYGKDAIIKGRTLKNIND